MEEFDDFDFDAGSNSELRYITLELMKLAYKRKKSFKQIAAEFVENVYFLQKLIEITNKSLNKASPNKSNNDK